MIGDILQPTHLLLILAVALLVLGPKRLPEVGRQLGSGIRDFRAAINGERTEQRSEVDRAGTESDSAQWETAPQTAPEHEFAHQTTESVSADHAVGQTAPDHEFASEPTAPTEAGTGSESLD